MASTQETQNLKNVIDQLSTELAKVKKDRTKLILESLILALERDEAVLGGEIYTKQLKEARARYKEEYQ